MITIDHNLVSGTGSHKNFPVLISIFDSDLHDDAQSNGNDIAFANDTAWLDHEIELFDQAYNSTHAQLVAWVRIPNLSTLKDTVIRIYYGNSTMTNQENPEGVWDSNYLLIHHLEEAPTGTITDSTGNNEDGSTTGSMNSGDLVDAWIGKGFDFDGFNDGILSSGTVSFSAFTITAWFNQGTNTDDWRTIISIGEDRQYASLFKRFVFWDDPTNIYFGNPGDLPNGNWHYGTLVYDGSNSLKAYVNGSQIGTTVSRSMSSHVDTYEIGLWRRSGPLDFFDGILDEVRLSNIDRSDDWIVTEYNNQYDPTSFYLVSKEYTVSDHPPNAHYFTYYKEIIIDHSMVSGPDDLLNFPVLISTFDENLHSKVQSDGDDIAFSDGVSWLDHELELFDKSYNSTHAQLVAWVRIPSLSTSVDTVIRMYYGNSTMTNQQNPTGVWNNDYLGIWHLSEDPSGTQPQMLDSTSNDNDGTSGGTMLTEDQVEFQIDGSLDFDGTDDYVNVGSASSLDNIEVKTVSAWVQLADIDQANAIVVKGSESAQTGWFLSYDSEVTRHRLSFIQAWSGAIAEWHTADFTMDVDTIFHVAVTYNRGSTANDPLLYIDGVSMAVTERFSPSGTIGNDAALDCFIAKYGLEPLFGYGNIDEVRISDVMRTAEWIATEYNNQYSPSTFYTISKEYTISGHPPNEHYFTYYKEITIDHTMVSGSEDFINFPVLISTFDEDLHNKVQIDGDDIAFTYNGAWLDHEIELFSQTFNSSHAQLIAWVSIPRLSTSENTIVRLYYGNSTMGSQENPEGVWDSSNLAVHHMEESPVGTLYDSTNNNEDLITQGSMTSGDLVDASIGQGIDFDDNNDGAVSSSTITVNQFTISAWINPDTVTDEYDTVVNVGHGAAAVRYFGLDNGVLYISDYDDSYSFGSALSSDTWHHIVVTYDGSTTRGYIDGSFEDSYSESWGQITYKFQVGAFAWGASYGLTDFFDGIIDEVRIINTPRSAGWIQTEYNNQFNPSNFFTVGPESVKEVTPPTYSNLIESSDPLELGGTEVITINVTDPSGINQVKIEFTGSNHSMTNTGGDTWQYDSWTPSSVDNYTYTIWMEDNYNNWNSTIGTIEVIDTTLPTYSDLIESADPLQLGQNETITIKVYDSPGSGVNQTLLEYDSSNHTMTFIGGNTWSWNNWKPTLSGIHPYKVFMQDMENNWNMTSGTITVVSTTAPLLENLTESEDPLELGNDITITIDVRDNESFVWDVLIELDGVNHTMTNIGGFTYEYNWTRSYVGIVYYTIYANDTENNWNSYSNSFDIIDTTPPVFSDLAKSDDPLEFGNTVIISINSTDLADINQVKIEFMGSNHTMTKISGYTWQYDSWTPNSVGNHTYTIWAEDNNTNWGFISDSILVRDTILPMYSDLTESSSTVELGDPLSISINCTDLTAIKDVSIEYENFNHTMENIGGDIWQHNSWLPNSIGNYTYKIYISDNNDNLNYVSSSILFQDTIVPVYANLIESADPLELGDNQIIRIDIYDFADINQSLIEFEGANHSMTNIYGNTWQFDSWTPNNWILHQYTIHMKDNSGNWNNLIGNITVQDTTPPPLPVLANSPSGDVSGILVFDWLDGSDPSGISYYILIIDNETDPYATPGYVYIFNITNVGSESSYYELPENLPLGRYYYFLAQIDGVGQQGGYTLGTFTVISIEDGAPENFILIIIVIILASVIGSVTAIVMVRKRLKKDLAPPRKKIPLRIILSHITKITSSKLALEQEELQGITSDGKRDQSLTSKELTDETALEIELKGIRKLGEELFNEGAYLEAKSQFKIARDILMGYNRIEEAKMFEELIEGIEGLIEERDKRLENLEQIKSEGNPVKIIETYYDLIEISQKLKELDEVKMYQSELAQYFKENESKAEKLEKYRVLLEQRAESLYNDSLFEQASKIYKKCEKVSQFLVQLGKDEENSNVIKFREKINECLKNLTL